MLAPLFLAPVHRSVSYAGSLCYIGTDLGDGWEREGWNREYFKEISAKKAYPMGINIVVYAMTH